MTSETVFRFLWVFTACSAMFVVTACKGTPIEISKNSTDAQFALGQFRTTVFREARDVDCVLGLAAIELVRIGAGGIRDKSSFTTNFTPVEDQKGRRNRAAYRVIVTPKQVDLRWVIASAGPRDLEYIIPDDPEAQMSPDVIVYVTRTLAAIETESVEC
jgi:hypothetical protein